MEIVITWIRRKYESKRKQLVLLRIKLETEPFVIWQITDFTRASKKWDNKQPKMDTREMNEREASKRDFIPNIQNRNPECIVLVGVPISKIV